MKSRTFKHFQKYWTEKLMKQRRKQAQNNSNIKKKKKKDLTFLFSAITPKIKASDPKNATARAK